MKTSFCVLLALLAIVSVGSIGCELVEPDLTEPGLTEAEIGRASEPAAQTNAPSPQVVRGGLEQFLWKPASENDGRLVVLLPSSLRGQVTSCTISGPSFGTEQGRFAGDTHNGYRPHYRFNRAGSGYGSDITVRATLQNGETRAWSVPNGSQRTAH